MVQEGVNTICSTQPVSIHKKLYCLEYTFHDKTYAVPFKIKGLHPSTFLDAMAVPINQPDTTQVDITTLIGSILGPCEDFHQVTLTPKELGFSSITIKYTDICDDPTTITFKENDKLYIPS